MRIELVTEGGFAALPGLQKPVVLDSAALPPDKATECDRLVRDVMAAPVADARPGLMRDGRQYRLTIGAEDGAVVCTASDLAMSPAYRSLLDLVRTYGQR